MTDVSRRKLSLTLAGIVAVVGVIFQFHDTILCVTLITAVGLVWSTRTWRACALGCVFVAGGLFWSSLDPFHLNYAQIHFASVAAFVAGWRSS